MGLKRASELRPKLLYEVDKNPSKTRLPEQILDLASIGSEEKHIKLTYENQNLDSLNVFTYVACMV